MPQRQALHVSTHWVLGHVVTLTIDFLEAEGGSQKATLVVLVPVVGISSPRSN